MNPITYGQGDSLGRPWPPEPILRVTLSCGHIVTVRKGVTEARCVQCGQVRSVVQRQSKELA